MSEGRRLRINVLRFNPQLEGDQARFVTYEIDEAENMTLYMVLTEVREEQEPSLQFDFVCRAGICGSCAMLIDGRPGLACRLAHPRRARTSARHCHTSAHRTRMR